MTRAESSRTRRVSALSSAAILLAIVLVILLVAGGRAASADPNPRTVVKTTIATWRRSLFRAARQDPTTRFRNFSRAEFMGRLRVAAKQYGFQIVRVEMLHPQQYAPLIVLRTANKLRLAHAAEAIRERLNPQLGISKGIAVTAFEGLAIEAQDNHGRPYFITFDNWRGGPGYVSGGQWAASPGLYPLPDMIR
jgi:hypothetical protein